jgi:hypothetical protein
VDIRISIIEERIDDARTLIDHAIDNERLPQLNQRLGIDFFRQCGGKIIEPNFLNRIDERPMAFMNEKGDG